MLLVSHLPHKVEPIKEFHLLLQAVCSQRRVHEHVYFQFHITVKLMCLLCVCEMLCIMFETSFNSNPSVVLVASPSELLDRLGLFHYRQVRKCFA